MERHVENPKIDLSSVPTLDLIGELSKRGFTFPRDQLSPLLMSESPQPEITPAEKTSSVERFVKAIERKNSFGKLPPGTTTDGRPLENLGIGSYNHGPDRLTPPRAERCVEIIQLHIHNNQNGYRERLSSHLVSVAPSETNRSNMVLTIRFFQDRKQIDSRGWCNPGRVSVEMPSTMMSELVGEIQKNPDLLEDFYQKAFPGLDSIGDEPGMRRVKATGFYLIQGKELVKANEAILVSGHSDSDIGRFFPLTQKYTYQNGPYGSGNVL